MTWHLTSLDGAAPAPWRNGGGVTRELAAQPGGADWTWRISVAEVAADGPFSSFPGVQRWFAVLGGAGVILKRAGAEHRLTLASAPLSFDGEEAVACELLHGPTRDLNLMVRRELASARMARVNGVRHLMAARAKVVAVYAVGEPAQLRHEGESVEVAPHTLAWASLPAGAEVAVTSASALAMEIEPWA